MKNKNIIHSIVILLYVAISVIDKFFLNIPDYIYIPVALLALAVLILIFIIDKKSKK